MPDAVSAGRAIYDAFASGDMPALDAGLRHIEWHETPGMPYGGVWHGFAEVAQHVFGPSVNDVPNFSAIPDQLLPLGTDRAVAFGFYRGLDDRVAAPFCHVWTVRDGRLVKFVQYADSHLYRQQAGLL